MQSSFSTSHYVVNILCPINAFLSSVSQPIDDKTYFYSSAFLSSISVTTSSRPTGLSPSPTSTLVPAPNCCPRGYHTPRYTTFPHCSRSVSGSWGSWIKSKLLDWASLNLSPPTRCGPVPLSYLPCFFCLWCWGWKPHMLGKHCTTELYPSPDFPAFLPRLGPLIPCCSQTCLLPPCSGP